MRISGRLYRPTCLAAGILAMALACAELASVTPQEVDVSPLQHVNPDLTHGLASGFSDWQGFISSEKRRDGVVERRSKDYVSVRDGHTEWMITAEITLYESTASAVARFERECAYAAGIFPDQSMQQTIDASWRQCISPIGQLRNDPEGGWLPSEEYLSYVILQRDDLMIYLSESYMRSAKTAKNPIVAEIAERLSKLE